MTQIEDKLREIEARANAATAGPWTETGDYSPDGEFRGVMGTKGRLVADLTDCDFIHDQAFIAASRTDVPRLVAALRRAVKFMNYAEKCMPVSQANWSAACQHELAKILTSGDQESEQS